jgi:hypothetical protein
MRVELVPKLAWRVHERGASSKASIGGCVRVEPVPKLAWRVHESDTNFLFCFLNSGDITVTV